MAYDPFSDDEAAAFLSGSAPAAKWPKAGFVFEGTVIDWRMDDDRDYDTGEMKYWKEGKATKESQLVPGEADKLQKVRQLVLTVQGQPTGITWEGLANTEKEIPDDDGMRSVYVKAALQKAFKEALGRARAKLEKGAYVRIERIKDGPKSNPKYAAPHRYTVQWTPADRNPETANALVGAGSGPQDNPWAD
jgi:hypothetical protein